MIETKFPYTVVVDEKRSSNTAPVDAMVVAPHPDDAEFGVGGTVARWSMEGKVVIYVICTNGDKGTTDRSITPKQLAAVRRDEQVAAARVLGVREVVFLDHPDQSLEDTLPFRKQIVRLIRHYRPAVVVTSDPYRRYLWHRDHRITGQVVLDAVFPLARDHLSFPDLLEEGLEPHKVQRLMFWAPEEINCRIDITDTFEMKVAALRCHISQVREFSDPRVEIWLRERCTKMAEGESYELAEAFHCVELPR